MTVRYIILSVLALGLGFGLFMMERKSHTNEIMPEQLLTEIADDSRFVSTDELAEVIVNGDPSYFLIDVRTAEEYKKFSLPGAINIPLSEILKEEWKAYFEQEAKNLVLFSNGTVYASQAWMLQRRLATPKMFILKGGLNQWAKDILSPMAPPTTSDSKEWDTYNTRLATRAYFGGGSVTTSTKKSTAKPVVRKKKKSVDGGC